MARARPDQLKETNATVSAEVFSGEHYEEWRKDIIEAAKRRYADGAKQRIIDRFDLEELRAARAEMVGLETCLTWLRQRPNTRALVRSVLEHAANYGLDSAFQDWGLADKSLVSGLDHRAKLAGDQCAKAIERLTERSREAEGRLRNDRQELARVLIA